jgi:hypothetical protein
MSNRSYSFGHRVLRTAAGYRIAWSIRARVEGRRARQVCHLYRDTTVENARRFAKRWSVAFPSRKRAA